MRFMKFLAAVVILSVIAPSAWAARMHVITTTDYMATLAKNDCRR